MADLRTAPLRVRGRLIDASNTTLLCELLDDAPDTPPGAPIEQVVYKPIRGELPLWDFPDGTLAGREVAAFWISERLGWDLIPPTLLREGPVGTGMVQRWIEPGQPTETEDDGAADAPVALFPPGAVPDAYLPVFTGLTDDPDAPQGYREIVLAHADTPRLRRLALLDVLLNNADRKGGHILTGEAGRLYGIDHGICLHSDPKLRTVLWGWAGRAVPADQLADIAALRAALGGDFGYRLRTLITADEVAALADRAQDLLDAPAMPSPPVSRAVPWPPF